MAEENTHFIYIIRTRESKRLEENIYKIGKTQQEPHKRMSGYGKGCEPFLVRKVNDCNVIEKIIINLFDVKYKHVPQYGREYYSGPIDSMIKDINRLCDREDLNDYSTDKTEKYSDSFPVTSSKKLFLSNRGYLMKLEDHTCPKLFVQNSYCFKCDGSIQTYHLCGNCRENYIDSMFFDYLLETEGIVAICTFCHHKNRGYETSIVKIKEQDHLKKLIPVTVRKISAKEERSSGPKNELSHKEYKSKLVQNKESFKVTDVLSDNICSEIKNGNFYIECKDNYIKFNLGWIFHGDIVKLCNFMSVKDFTFPMKTFDYECDYSLLSLQFNSRENVVVVMNKIIVYSGKFEGFKNPDYYTYLREFIIEKMGDRSDLRRGDYEVTDDDIDMLVCHQFDYLNLFKNEECLLLQRNKEV